MGSKNKLKRFRENETFSNVIQPERKEVLNGFSKKGKWNLFFDNSNPIVLELGCGKGEYTIALARKNPAINYIGIDIKGARFWRGAKTAAAHQRSKCSRRVAGGSAACLSRRAGPRSDRDAHRV